MNTRISMAAGGLLPAIMLLASCGQVRLANDPLTLSKQGSSLEAVQARSAAANAPAKQPTASPSPASAAAALSQPAEARDMSSMPGMAAAASAPASAVPAPEQAHVAYDARLTPAPTEAVVHITLTAKEGVQEIAPGVKYAVWTFGDTAPGPIIHVKQNDTMEFTLKNEGTMQHSIDFHAAETPWNVNYRSINPGESLSFTFKADHPGVFMYHCGTAPALMHIGNGMYGAIIVDPATPLPAAREYVLVQSEFYTKPSATKGVLDGDYTKMQNGRPDYVVFNGMANQYTGNNSLTANPGELIRLWTVNAGPNDFSAFHVVGAILGKVYPDGNPANALSGMQTYTVPPGGGAMIELTIPNEGFYPVVTHSFADASKGALAMIKVGNPPPAAGGH